MWKNLVLFVNTGDALSAEQLASNPGEVHTRSSKTRPRYNATEAHTLKAIANRVIITRNPFARFVSSWKDFLARNRIAPGAGSNLKVTFSQFVDMVKTGKYKRYQHLHDHIHSISARCHPREFKYTLVLRLEEMSVWY